MKNLHLIPTDKPSHLHLWTDENDSRLELCELEYSHTRNTQNIYITNSEEIKEGDWFYDLDTKYVKIKQSWENSHLDFNGKKIILTTDQDLIKDGVQAIDDEFLEWLVKNPSCDCIEVEDANELLRSVAGGVKFYKIIIPQEEPKQEPCDNCNNDICCCTIRTQETLKEVKDLSYYKANAEEDYLAVPISVLRYISELEERMYSEEEVISLLNDFAQHLIFNKNSSLNIIEWFEQFKKK